MPMSYRTNTDNIYKEGTIITARENPALKLVIVKYYQRIYYCASKEKTDGKQLAYFEKELIPPKASEHNTN